MASIHNISLAPRRSAQCRDNGCEIVDVSIYKSLHRFFYLAFDTSG